MENGSELISIIVTDLLFSQNGNKSIKYSEYLDTEFEHNHFFISSEANLFRRSFSLWKDKRQIFYKGELVFEESYEDDDCNHHIVNVNRDFEGWRTKLVEIYHSIYPYEFNLTG